jgi:hypothetical protein
MRARATKQTGPGRRPDGRAHASADPGAIVHHAGVFTFLPGPLARVRAKGTKQDGPREMSRREGTHFGRSRCDRAPRGRSARNHFQPLPANRFLTAFYAAASDPDALPAGIEGRQIPALSPVNAARSAQSCCWHRMWSELVALCGDAGDNDPVFRSPRRRPRPEGVPRIVNAAGCRAGLPASPQGLRHAYSSHALERGANLALVRDTAGHAG